MFDYIVKNEDDTSSSLIIVFNSLADDGSVDNSKYDFEKTFENLETRTMFFKNLDYTWFLNDFSDIEAIVCKIIINSNVKNVYIIGHSCGGFAGLIFPFLIRDLVKETTCYIFSPQTNLEEKFIISNVETIGNPEDMSLFVNHENILDENTKYYTCKDFMLDNVNYNIYFCKQNRWDTSFIDELGNCKVNVFGQECDHHASAYFCKCTNQFNTIFKELFP